jgi:WD40 repeat protein
MLLKALGLVTLVAASLPGGAAPSFSRDIQPILKKNCQGCHQPASKMSGLDLTTFDGFSKGGKRGPAFVAERPDDSVVVRYLTAALQPRMPLGEAALPESEIALVKEWIRDGAKNDSVPETTELRTPIYLQPPVITALRFSPDGSEIAVSGNGEVLIHSADGKAPLRRLMGSAERILSLAYSVDGKLLIAGGGTPAQFGEVQVWDAKSGKLLRSARVTGDTVFGASLSPDESKIAVGGTDNSVHMIETASGKELYKISNHENWVLATVFGIDSKRFVSASGDRAAKLIDASSGAFLENVNLLRGELAAIARHPKKDIVVIGGAERIPYIYLLDRPRNMKIADDSTLVRKLDRQDGAITALDWSPDGIRIAVAGMAPTVNLYDPDTGEKKASCKGHEAGIYAIAFSPDSTKLATGGFDGKVRIYSTTDCALVRSFVPAPLSAGSTQ